MAKLIADKMAAMIISPHHNIVHDSCDDVLALTAPVQMTAPKVNVEFSTEAQGCKTGLIQAPALYHTSSNISSVQHAWSEWSYGSTTIAERVKQTKADTILVLNGRNSSLHEKSRHLPPLIQSLIQLGATSAIAISLGSPDCR